MDPIPFCTQTKLILTEVCLSPFVKINENPVKMERTGDQVTIHFTPEIQLTLPIKTLVSFPSFRCIDDEICVWNPSLSPISSLCTQKCANKNLEKLRDCFF